MRPGGAMAQAGGQPGGMAMQGSHSGGSGGGFDAGLGGAAGGSHQGCGGPQGFGQMPGSDPGRGGMSGQMAPVMDRFPQMRQAAQEAGNQRSDEAGNQQSDDVGNTTQATPNAGGSGSSNDNFEDEINRIRRENGLPELTRNSALDQAANAHAQDQQGRELGHTGSDGSSPGDRARRAGYDSSVRENVAWNYSDEADVAQGWMNSPGHRAAMLDPNATEFGYARIGQNFVLLMGGG